MSRVARYCEQAKLSRPVNAYLYTYDSNRDFLVCRNHKVIHSWNIGNRAPRKVHTDSTKKC